MNALDLGGGGDRRVCDSHDDVATSQSGLRCRTAIDNLRGAWEPAIPSKARRTLPCLMRCR